MSHEDFPWTYFLLILTLITVAESDSDEFQSNYIMLSIIIFINFIILLVTPNEALQFLFRARRSFLHPGKTKCEEQKREARKAYEEKCSMLGKRFCPKLSAWKDFQQWEIGGGYESKRNPLPTLAPTPQIPTLRTYHTRLYTPATLRTYRTPMYGSMTIQENYRTPVYGNKFVTPNPFDD
ncbi:unnamed protein product [Rotaria sp. Silwood2]|nr:unnamed protein product [Rotaria sp. Silwood2]